MRYDSCLYNYILDLAGHLAGVSNPDQGKRITLELYFTFKLSAGEDAVCQFEFAFTSNNLVISGI